MKPILISAIFAGMIAAVANAQNANITWQMPLTISGTSDVNTSGTLYGTWAPGDDYYGDFNLVPENYTVNGVAFNTYGTPGVNFGLSGDNINLDRYNGFANPGTGDSTYNNLLQVAIFNWNNPTSITLSWNNMTAGNTYLVELWLNDGRSGQSGSSTFTGGANTSDSVFIGNGAPGQYIIGTFVADNSGSQNIAISPGIMINLVQVRDITPVPEPATIALVGMGAGAMLHGFRRKSARAKISGSK
ncbi:MAG: PEP-CTERM sorting domain-containing protein [Limisphaerales bacterium]